MYEEELSLRDGFRWSPDSKSIAFWQFDSTGVEQFSIINNTDSLPENCQHSVSKGGHEELFGQGWRHSSVGWRPFLTKPEAVSIQAN